MLTDKEWREIKVRNRSIQKFLLLEIFKLMKKNKKLQAKILNQDLREDQKMGQPYLHNTEQKLNENNLLAELNKQLDDSNFNYINRQV